MKLTRIALAAMLAPLAMCAQAEVTFTPMATYHLFDSDQKEGLEDTAGYALGLGYRFTKAIGLEAHYGRTEPNFEDGPGDGRDSRLTLDGYYTFNADGKFSPYILAGGGQENQAYEGDANFESTIANVAVGAFYRFNQYVALRAEVRDVYNFDIESNDQIVGLGIEFSGGDGGSSQTSASPEPQPEPEQQVEQAAAAAAPVVAAVVDSDGDGVADVADKCSESPAGVQVDADGCPLDADKDGVADYRDQCPTTAEGVVVDEKGCDQILTEAISKELNVSFDAGKAVVKDEYKAQIGEVATLLKQYPGTKAEIQGHTDASGKKASNDKLSQQRADAVKAVLVNDFGVDASRVTAKGYGSSKPVADNKTAEGKAQNRRVMAIISGEAKKVQKKK